jgi:hypothetical protein
VKITRQPEWCPGEHDLEDAVIVGRAMAFIELPGVDHPVRVTGLIVVFQLPGSPQGEHFVHWDRARDGFVVTSLRKAEVWHETKGGGDA